jgi:hypothetical protein
MQVQENLSHLLYAAHSSQPAPAPLLYCLCAAHRQLLPQRHAGAGALVASAEEDTDS